MNKKNHINEKRSRDIKLPGATFCDMNIKSTVDGLMESVIAISCIINVDYSIKSI